MGATRYGHNLTRRRTRGKKQGGGRDSWRYISSKSAELMLMKIPGVLVEPRRRYQNFLICMASTACSEACLVLHLRVKLSSCVKSTRCPRDDTLVHCPPTDRRTDRIDRRTYVVDRRTGRIGRRTYRIDRWTDRIERRTDRMDRRTDRIDRRTCVVDRRAGRID